MRSKNTFKNWMRAMHLWIALTTGLFVLTLSITGAILIYAKDIQAVINPQYWTVTPQPAPPNVGQLIHQVETAFGQSVATVSVEPDHPNWAWQFRMHNTQHLSVDPYTGEILLQYQFDEHLYGFVMSLHRWLLYSDGNGATPLRNWVSIVATILIMEVLIGFYLWAKPKKRLKRLKINLSAKPKVLLYQLHTVLGVALCLPLILIAFSGIAFNWQSPTSVIVNALSPGQIVPRPDAPVIDKGGADLALDAAIVKGLEALPRATLYRIYLPSSPQDSLKLRVQMPGESHAHSWVWSNPYTGEVLQIYDATRTSAATQVWNFKYKFHIGGFAGPLLEIVWFVIALSPCFFTVSGVYFWIKRRNKSKTNNRN